MDWRSDEIGYLPIDRQGASLFFQLARLHNCLPAALAAAVKGGVSRRAQRANP
jgi:hypothetical protein